MSQRRAATARGNRRSSKADAQRLVDALVSAGGSAEVVNGTQPGGIEAEIRKFYAPMVSVDAVIAALSAHDWTAYYDHCENTYALRAGHVSEMGLRHFLAEREYLQSVSDDD